MRKIAMLALMAVLSMGGCPDPGFGEPPDLATMRADARHVPGFFGAGGTYRLGKLQALHEAELITTVIVQRKGLNPSNQNLQWLFETATDHTEKGLEFVVIYYLDQPPSLGIYDWSLPTPAWAWTLPLADFTNNITRIKLPDGTKQSAIRYVNATMQTSSGWVNEVWMWNYVKGTWDVEYTHAYGGTLQDCSVIGCENWFNTLETFPVDVNSPLPKIREVGFIHSELGHDGQWSWLGPDVTILVPPGQPWSTLLFWPNGTLVAGDETQ